MTASTLSTPHEPASNIEQFTGEILDNWEHTSLELSAVIGEAGFHALFARSLHLTRQTYPWLANARNEDGAMLGSTAAMLPTLSAFDDLKSSLETRTLDQARSANAVLTRTFQDLLVSLIGDSLARRLLATVWVEISPESSTIVDTSPGPLERETKPSLPQ